MANRTLYIEIVITKYAKELFSKYTSASDYIGSVQFIFNGGNKNTFMYTNEGVVNTSVPGALRYYSDHGFDFSKTSFFDAYETEYYNKKIHKFSFSLDEKQYQIALKYGLLTNKLTNSVIIPSGKDVYNIRFDYEKNFNPELILVESYADKMAKLRLEEQKRQIQRKIEEDKANQELSKVRMNAAIEQLGFFRKYIDEYFAFDYMNNKDQECYEKLEDTLAKALAYIRSIPYQEYWTKDWHDFTNSISNLREQFYEYILDKKLQNPKSLFSPEYGRIHDSILEKSKTYTKSYADQFVNNYIHYYESKDWYNFSKINVNDILHIIWFYATYKPFDTEKFSKIKKLYSIVYDAYGIETFIAECYVRTQLATEDAIRDLIHAYTQNIFTINNPEIIAKKKSNLHNLASALNWMKAYKQEEEVLRSMLKLGEQMTAKEQERLHLLSTANGVNLTEVHENYVSDALNIRMDSLDWKVDEYRTFFDNLAFQDKNLVDYLAIRDEVKDIVLNPKIKFPSLQEITENMQPIFEEEYGDIVKVSFENVYRVSIDESEEMEGLLAITEEAPTLGLFALFIRIGKKLNIKFYTLYLPENIDTDQQAKKAISMQKKLSPTITMWENSLKDTFLSAMEQILNTAVVSKKKDIDEIEEF